MRVGIITTVATGAIALAVAATAATSPAIAAAKRCQPFGIPSGGAPAYDRAVIVSGHVGCAAATKVLEMYVGSGMFTTPTTVLGYSCSSKTKSLAGGGVQVLSQTCRKGRVVFKAVSA